MNDKKLLIGPILMFCVLCLCLVGCGPAETSEPTQTVPVSTLDDTALLVGIWENEGQYEAGKDFVETLTLYADGTAAVHLVYQGEDYADLAGSWTAEKGVLTVVLYQSPDSDPVTRVYQYQADETSLTLQGESKEVFYNRIG